MPLRRRAFPKFWPRRFLAATARDRALFGLTYIASLALRLFALTTSLIFFGHHDRVPVRRGLGAPDAPGVVEVFVVVLEREWRHTAPCRGCRRPCVRMDVQPGCLAPCPGFSRTRVFAHTARAGYGPDGRACWREACATSALACRELHTWLWRNEGADAARIALACGGLRNWLWRNDHFRSHTSVILSSIPRGMPDTATGDTCGEVVNPARLLPAHILNTRNSCVLQILVFSVHAAFCLCKSLRYAVTGEQQVDETLTTCCSLYLRVALVFIICSDFFWWVDCWS